MKELTLSDVCARYRITLPMLLELVACGILPPPRAAEGTRWLEVELPPLAAVRDWLGDVEAAMAALDEEWDTFAFEVEE